MYWITVTTNHTLSDLFFFVSNMSLYIQYVYCNGYNQSVKRILFAVVLSLILKFCVFRKWPLDVRLVCFFSGHPVYCFRGASCVQGKKKRKIKRWLFHSVTVRFVYHTLLESYINLTTINSLYLIWGKYSLENHCPTLIDVCCGECGLQYNSRSSITLRKAKSTMWNVRKQHYPLKISNISILQKFVSPQIFFFLFWWEISNRVIHLISIL